MARDLNAELRDKTQEILELIAIAYGLGDVASLDASWLQQLNHDVEQIIGQHEEAMFGGETSKEWYPLDERLAQTAIGRFLQERQEINDQILDLPGMKNWAGASVPRSGAAWRVLCLRSTPGCA
jgi:hypothetical protein